MTAKYWVVAITTNNEVGREIKLPATTINEATLLANSLFFLLTGEISFFDEKRLKKEIPRISITSKCKQYYIEIVQAGALDYIPGIWLEQITSIKGGNHSK